MLIMIDFYFFIIGKLYDLKIRNVLLEVSQLLNLDHKRILETCCYAFFG